MQDKGHVAHCSSVFRFLVVFSSPGNRVPPDIQAILLQSSIPFTLLLSVFILKKRYKPLQIVGGVVVMGGIFLSMSKLASTMHHAFWLIPRIHSTHAASIGLERQY